MTKTDLSDFEALIDEAGAAKASLAGYMKFVHNWQARPHQKPWVEALEALIREPGCFDEERHAEAGCFRCRVHKEKRLLIVAPPGFGKTDTLIEFVAWAIGQDPEAAAFAFFSYNDNIATERSMSVRDTVYSSEPTEMNERYALLFPNLKPAKDRPWSQERWFAQRKDRSRKDPTLVAAGMDGSVNARRLLGLVLDDPHNAANSATQHQRDMVKKGYNAVVRTRLTNDAWQVCISTRWARDDLAGYFMELGWPTLRTPALNDDGESNWPYEGPNLGYKTETLQKYRDEDPTTFMLAYQGTVVKEAGKGLIPLPVQTFETVPVKFSKVIQVWDTASEVRESASESACVTFGKALNGKVWWLDSWSGHIGFNELMPMVVEKHDELEDQGIAVDKVLIEAASTGSALIPQVRANTGLGWKVQPVTVGGRGRTRGERVLSVAKYFEVVHIPAEAAWKGKALSQLISYGTPGVKDDILQAAVHALGEMFPPMRPVPQIRIIDPTGVFGVRRYY